MKNIALLIGLIFAVSAKSQVIYTDVNPNLTLQALNSDSYAVDFNNDSNIDVVIYESEVDTNLNGFLLTFIGGVVNTLGASELVGTDSLIFGANILFVDTIGVGELIDGSLGYINSNMPSVFAGAGIRVTATALNTALGEFEANKDGFIGVKFAIAGATHFGWIRVSAAADCYSLIIKDFAYEATPNTGIVAGDYGGSGFVAVKDQFLNLDYKVTNNILYISGYQYTDNQVLNLTNVIGQELINRKVENESEAIDLSKIPTGFYLVHLFSTNGSVVKKIYVR
ncbi:MAG: T9SS type A sorting domain-containing protein [Parvicellaceae bacterium]